MRTILVWEMIAGRGADGAAEDAAKANRSSLPCGSRRRQERQPSIRCGCTIWRVS